MLNSAWDAGIPVASENALPCYDRVGFNKILENAKPRKDPDGRCLAAFTYLRLNPTLMEEQNFKEFARFVKRLHGESAIDPSSKKYALVSSEEARFVQVSASGSVDGRMVWWLARKEIILCAF